ncbi:hypothetical protein V1514DRAFT_333111 [Lipomyces japonicus]|uniref:uncharacterized protein n=1 Tax=Lipomyces japonicus TaxID=56871 RepID=UPI0034CE98D9
MASRILSRASLLRVSTRRNVFQPVGRLSAPGCECDCPSSSKGFATLRQLALTARSGCECDCPSGTTKRMFSVLASPASRPSLRLLAAAPGCDCGGSGNGSGRLVTISSKLAPGCDCDCSTGSRGYTTKAGAADVSTEDLSFNDFHAFSDETLELIATQIEDISANEAFKTVDFELSQGVLTLQLPPNGTYVINKQPPNKQIWLSSPISGPKRYNFLNGKWIYNRDGTTLGDLLRAEVTKALGFEVKFEGVDDWES